MATNTHPTEEELKALRRAFVCTCGATLEDHPGIVPCCPPGPNRPVGLYPVSFSPDAATLARYGGAYPWLASY